MRRLAFLLVWLIELLLVTTGVAMLAAWIWSGTDGSLATALKQAQAYLPAGQTIETQDVSGAIRDSGRIGTLRWQADGLSVHARDLRFSWQPSDLLQGRLHFGSVAIAEVEIDDKRPATEPTPPQPPPEVLLPIALNLPFSVDRFRLRGATALDVTDIAGRYQFSDERHQLQLDSISVAQGKYSGHLSLQAKAPMTLDLQLQGTVTAPVADQSITLEASATLRGPLAGTNASLDLLAQLQPAAGASGALAQARAMRASVSAQISPWATQPVARAQASFNQLDLAALWPTAPRTLLTGNAWVRPVGNNWLVDFNLINRAAGPWDKGMLPLDSAKGLVEMAGKQWSVESLHAEAAGGTIRLQGALADPSTASATSGWQGKLQIQGVDPARLHTQMESVRLNGEVTARAQKDGVNFDASLQPAKEQTLPNALRGVRLRDAAASGRWADGWLRVDKLRIRTADASLDGRADLEIASTSASAQLQLVAPGLRADLSGKFSALDGNGDLALKLSDAAQTRAWLAQLPQMPAVVDTLDLQGNADLSLQWTGGWESLQSGRGATPSVKARLQVPRLAVRERKQAADTTMRVSALDAQVSGTLDALTVTLRGNAARAGQRMELETSASGGRDARGDWQGTLRTLQLQAQDKQLPGPWNLALAQPVTASFASATGELAVGGAQAKLSGPEPGEATLAWEPISWKQRDGGASLVSKGALRGLPMGWITLLANADLEAAGLSGNLLFDGQWDVTLADKLVARATLARRSGDIRIQAENAPTAGVGVTTSSAKGTINAGIRELQLQVSADGDTVKADFRWDSERAGNAQAAVSTRLTRNNDGWSWTEDSPLEATLRANMPQVGVWSLLAPPGWRVRGTLETNLSLTGTQRTPQWSGSLLASEMAVRSVVDGIEFGNGQLKATLQGQRLNIESFSLQGAGGANGGELTATGFATWTPASNPKASAIDAIRLQIDAQAKELRVSARADRRLAVSGTLQALLDKAKLQIRGAFNVDQALFILPDETAPSLGGDVVVLRKGQARPSAAAKPAPTTKVADKSPQSTQGTPGSTLDADLLVTLDLGEDFQVRGRGIDTRVAGELTLRSKLKPGESPTVTGELRTVGGQFRAYGQQLEIETGVMRFTGPYDNPSLNILAIRPKLTQRVGVQITGSALLPRVRLYAEPDLPESEKLAWLVLGRSGANGGAEAAVLQQAAMALLGGESSDGGFAGRLGLDEISLGGATEGGAASATVTLGKRISQNFYVAYESSLAGALGSFSIFYDLSERFTLRARTGEKSAVDLIFKYSYD